MDVQFGKCDLGTNLHLWSFNGTQSQTFWIHPEGTIRSDLTELVIGISRDTTAAGHLLMCDKKGYSDNVFQLWDCSVNFKNDDQIIKSKSQDLCFDTFEHKTSNGTLIVASKITNEKTQVWKMEEIKIKSFFIQHQESGL